ncbi:MAG: helix-turn-helix transcriptional regulator [Candidatus Aureabacteria bacterium]|nr:helix-turn-helix transcriptional regulator [Candidatus Auribacterota bacterium]
MKGGKGAFQHFGEYLKALRFEKRITLREFCKRAQADPGNISKIERSIWPPPQDSDILERYAAALEIKKGTDKWYRFSDLAAADRGIIPRDLLSDKEVIKMLPIFFRTLRRQRPTPEELDRLVEKLRRA